MTIVRYLDPTNDVAFKKIFGKEKNKDILIHFLNDILIKNESEKIKDVNFINPILDPDIASRTQSIIDVLCTDENGVQYIVEMQVAKVGGFEKRAQYYAARAYINQMRKGEAYENLKEVIFLAIVDFVMFPEKEHYKSEHVVLDKSSFENDLKDFSFTFIELPKFKKEKIEELETYEEKWCYFFKNSDNPHDIAKLIDESDHVISKAYDELRSYHWTDEELLSYEANMKIIMDAQARERYVLKEAKELAAFDREKVWDEACEEGREKGLQEGREEGKELGIKESSLAMAKKMLIEGFSQDIIIKITNLTDKDIISLKDHIS